MGFLMLGWAVIQYPVLVLVPLLLVIWSLAIIETQNEEHWAKAYGYREPKNANGSKARYFFYMLQRYANKAS